MPVYEYECKECEKVFEVQQKMVDDPIKQCPDCNGPVTKLVSMSSFQLKGGGWYSDGYSNTPAKPASCKPDTGCANCPAASS